VQALEVIRNHDADDIYALSCGTNIDLLREQVREFSPSRVVVGDVSDAHNLQMEFPGLQIDYGEQGLISLADDEQIDFMLLAIVGIAGLAPLLTALKRGITVALANKEPLVAAGELVMSTAAAANARIIPVDSEHSAIFQCLQGNPGKPKEIILTASGGPFLRRPPEELKLVTPEEAGRHPRWQMGVKISIDSATMINKALEMIEAHRLFGLDPHQIKVVIHPESIVHSMVTFVDGSTLAQLSLPDMRLPIAYALSWPNRRQLSFPTLDWQQNLNLHFEPPDEEAFPALTLARRVMEAGGDSAVVFNAANEEAVAMFRRREIPFTTIVPLVTAVTNAHTVKPSGNLQSIMALHNETIVITRAKASEMLIDN